MTKEQKIKAKEYPQGFGCIRGKWGHFECALTESNLDFFSPETKPPKSELVMELGALLGRKLYEKITNPK